MFVERYVEQYVERYVWKIAEKFVGKRGGRRVGNDPRPVLAVLSHGREKAGPWRAGPAGGRAAPRYGWAR
ncbi:hypothetical protein [Protofrankia sp. BMG5.30]|nr:hypothetical protein [Protofrankia sp. BMG5.30]